VTPRVDKTMAKHLKKMKGRGQVNIRLDDDLLEWVRLYAKRKNTTLTWIVDDYLRELRAKDTEVPQI
jgi:hypothetical protein